MGVPKVFYTFGKCLSEKNKSGSSADIVEVDSLFKQGQAYIKKHKGQVEIDFSNADEMFSQFMAGIKQVDVAGSELLLGKI